MPAVEVESAMAALAATSAICTRACNALRRGVYVPGLDLNGGVRMLRVWSSRDGRLRLRLTGTRSAPINTRSVLTSGRSAAPSRRCPTRRSAPGERLKALDGVRDQIALHLEVGDHLPHLRLNSAWRRLRC